MHKLLLVVTILLIQIANGQTLLPKQDPAWSSKPKHIWSADWSIDDKYIALGGDDSLLRIFDAATFEPVKIYRISSMIKQLSWHPIDKGIIAIAGIRGGMSILNIHTGDTISLAHVSKGSRTIGWNYNGQLLAIADEGLVKICDRKGRLLRVITKPHRNTWLSVDWHPHENKLVVSGDDIRIMDTAGNTLKVIQHRKEQTGILTVRWHPSGDFFVSGDYGHYKEGVPSLIQFWNTNGELLKTISPGKLEFRILSWSKGGEMLVSSGDALRIWTKTGELLYEASPENGTIWGLDWNSTNERIIMATFDGAVKLWDSKAKLLKIVY
jgi:WD40 repeat protein